MFIVLLQILCIQVLPPGVFSTSASQSSLLVSEKWQSVRRRRFAISNRHGLDNTHLHRVDGLDPFADHRRSEDQSWMQQGRASVTGNTTCRPFAEVRKIMEDLHARAKETALELIAALGRMQAQAQLEKTHIDGLKDAERTKEDALKNCKQQKEAAASNAEKYGKELKELQQIAQADAAIFNISQSTQGTPKPPTTKLIQEKGVSPGSAYIAASLLQRGVEGNTFKRLGAEEQDELDRIGEAHRRPGISLADALGHSSHGGAAGAAMSKTLYNNVQQAAKELKQCLAEAAERRLHADPTAAPTESPEKCQTHKERLKKMFAAAYAHIDRIKEKYEDLAADDSCDKAAEEEFGGRVNETKEELNATRRHLCSVHTAMGDLNNDAKEIAERSNATDKLLQDMGCKPPQCKPNGWSEYHSVILTLSELVKKHPVCAKCCEEKSEKSLLQENEEKLINWDNQAEAVLQEELPDDSIPSMHPVHASSHYWSL